MKPVTIASVVAVVGVLLPSALRAALSISIPDPIPVFPPDTGPRFFDLIFHETGTPENEQLTVYDLGIALRRPAGVTGGINFVAFDVNDPNFDPSIFAASPNFVFPRNSVVLVESDPDHIQLNFENTGTGVNGQTDVADGMSAGRIYYTVDPGFPYGLYSFVIHPDNTVFASADALAIPVDLSDTGNVIAVPEPTAAWLLAAAGLLALRRRRVAS